MKYPTGILTTIMLIAAFVLSGCDSPSNKMSDSETTEIESTQDSNIAANEEEVRVYRVENADRFREFNRTKGDIELQIENESDEDVKAELETKLEGYSETQDELNRELDNYQLSESDNWDDFKDSFSDKMDDLGNSLDDFFTTNTTSN